MSLFYNTVENTIILTQESHLKLRQEYSTTSMMVLAASLSLRPGLNLALCNTQVM